MKNTFKKVLFSLWAIGLVWAWTLGMVNAQSIINNQWWASDPTAVWNQNLQYNPWANTTSMKNDGLIITIKNFINRVLWLLSLIAMALCLWWGFQMLTANWDETKYKKWFTILKQAWIGLAIIALSWLIVSLIFRVINKNAAAWTDGGGTAPARV